jgi:hypothetical protein
MGKLFGRLRAAFVTGALATSVAAAVGAAQPASATDNLCTDVGGYFWSTEQDMADASTLSCRRTWIIDPGQHNKLTRQQLVQEHAGFYATQGIPRQFLWYATDGPVHIPAGSPQEFSACVATPDRNGNECKPENVVHDPRHSISYDFGGRAVDLSTLNWNGDFIALVCGNVSVPGQVEAPVPTIRGFKFNDANRNRVQDAGEGGVEGIEFHLIRLSSEFGDQGTGYVATTFSGADGSFAFALNDMGPGSYRVEEIAHDGWVSTTEASRDVPVPSGAGNRTFDVTFGNRAQHPPVADAGPDQTVDQTSSAGASVTLDGSKSSDPDGDELTYTWTGDFPAQHVVSPTITLPPGTWTVTLTVSDGLASDTDTTTVTVYPPITVTGQDTSSLEGLRFSGTVGSFTDPDPDGLASEYAATIDWGDGTPASTGTIEKGMDGVFAVTGEHTYAEEGDHAATLTVADASNLFNIDQGSFTGHVTDAAIHASGLHLDSQNPFDGVVATFTDENPGAPLSDFTATIDWGDGTAPTAGIISGPVGGVFSVSGSHRYATLGPKVLNIHVVDEGGATDDTPSDLLLWAPAAGGNFVIGDRNAAVGTSVTFWGAQWWKLNSLSGGTAPAAFKGFANSPAFSATLNSWTTSPGNSPPPPASVPTYMAVIVSSSIGQSGSTISGDAPHIVIVKTDPGYSGNPGHEGTGTVVAVLR